MINQACTIVNCLIAITLIAKNRLQYNGLTHYEHEELREILFLHQFKLAQDISSL